MRQEFPQLLRLARRARGWTLAVAAGRVGVTRSALCRYELGDERALGVETLRRLCVALELPVPAWLDEERSGPGTGEGASGAESLYWCPVPFCPRHRCHVLADRVVFRPRAVRSLSGSEVVCRGCGATLLEFCEGCDAAFRPGSVVCPRCGTPYVAPAVLPEDALRALSLRESEMAAGEEGEVEFWPPTDAAASARARDRLGGLATAEEGGVVNGHAS
ncbi:MAG: helix-turn-helix domain-containing protein [Lentisphaeria bacterium]|nr:helix-turn-helix domain-containing protein [Lentisphaeria bacterium]